MKVRKTISSAFLVGLLILPMGAAITTTVRADSDETIEVRGNSVSVGGGTWNYGVGLTGSYSDYYHGNRVHTAATTHKDSPSSYGKADPGYWAKSRLTKLSGCSYYWNVL